MIGLQADRELGNIGQALRTIEQLVERNPEGAPIVGRRIDVSLGFLVSHGAAGVLVSLELHGEVRDVAGR